VSRGLVLVEREPEGRIATVLLNRPDRLNALNEELMGALVESLQELDSESEVRCIVLGGSARAFAAGADIAEMADASVMDMVAAARVDLWYAIRAVKSPLVAAVSGYCLGGGCELAMACDVIVASETAQFGQPEINLGIIPGGGGTQRLARVLGKQRAMQLVLTGERFDAATALELGLVNKVVEGGGWLEEAMALAATVAERPPIAVRLAKQAVLVAEETALSPGIENERRLYELAMATEDRVEGMRAFLEKREPKFEGK